MVLLLHAKALCQILTSEFNTILDFFVSVINSHFIIMLSFVTLLFNFVLIKVIKYNLYFRVLLDLHFQLIDFLREESHDRVGLFSMIQTMDNWDHLCFLYNTVKELILWASFILYYP